MSIKTIGALLLGAAALASGGEASAQQDPPPSAVGANVTEPEASPEPGEMVVTARRRNEAAERVPIAMSVVGSKQIEAAGVYTLGQLQQLAPSLQVLSFNPRNTNINIRGLGSNVALANDGLENGVGVYLDEVYLGRVGLAQFELADLDRVEVLRGPQGTLFGKNTTSGAINVSTRAPAFSTEAHAEASGGNYDDYQVKGSISGPVFQDVLAARLSASGTHRDGFLHNVSTGNQADDFNNLQVRGQLLWLPRPSISVRLIGDYGRQRLNCCINVTVGTFTTLANGSPIPNNFLQRAARLGYAPLPFDPFARKTDADSPFQADMDLYGLTGLVKWSLPFGELTSVTAYRWWNWNPANDADNIGLPINTVAQLQDRQRQFSQELRLASSGVHRVDYVAGLYYFWQVVNGYGSFAYGAAAPAWFLPTTPAVVANLALNGFTAASTSTPTTKSYAAFGQTVWHIVSGLDLTTGLRFTHEDKHGAFNQFQTGGASLAGLTPAQQAAAQAIRNSFNANTSFTASSTDNSFSGLATLSYEFNPDVMAYATYSRGAKSGGLNLTNLPAGVDPVVKPERIDNYEAGFKSRLFGHRAVLNAAVFWTNVFDYQTSIAQPNALGAGFLQYISNIKQARSRGGEVDAQWSLSRRISLNASVSYVDAIYVSYTNGTCPIEVSLTPAVCDLSGKSLAGPSKWSYSLGADVSQPVSDNVETYQHVDYAYRTSYYTAVSDSRYSRVPGYGLVNVRAGLRAPGGSWDASVWAKNLLNKDYFQTISAANTGLITGLLGAPRTFGVTLSGRY